MNKWFEQALYKTGDPMVNKHMKKCLTGKQQLTTDWLELEKSTKPNVGKDVAQSELWCFEMGIQIDTIILEKYLVSSTNIDVQAGFRKGRGTRDQLANIRWIIEKAREFQKNIYFCFIDYAKALDCLDHNKLQKFWKRWEYQTTWPASWKICIQVRKQQLELDMEQQTGSK